MSACSRRRQAAALSSDVIEEKLGAGRIAKKHIGNIKFDDVTVRVGFSMSKAIYDWISASWDDHYQRKNGAIHAADSKKNVKHTLEFFNALLTETTIPACDASSKEPAYLTLKFAPELTRSQLGTGKLEGAAEKKQKLWTPSAFRLAIDGLPCNRVSKIESLTIKQLVTESAIGDIRDYEKEPAKLEIPNLKITFDEADIGPWSDWFDHFVVQGFSGEADEKNGNAHVPRAESEDRARAHRAQEPRHLQALEAQVRGGRRCEPKGHRRALLRAHVLQVRLIGRLNRMGRRRKLRRLI